MAENDKLFTEFAPSSHDEWIAATIKSLKGKPFEKLIKTTYEGFDVQPMYRADDIEDIAHKDTLPGQYPYVRGTHVDGYLSQPWQVAQSMNIIDPEAFNRALKNDLERGQTEIHISNIPPLSTLRKELFQPAFADIDLTQYPLVIYADRAAYDIYGLLWSAYYNRDSELMKGCIADDPVRLLARTGKFSQADMDSTMYYVKLWGEKSPNLDMITVQTDIYHNAGANAVQELGIALATGVTYLAEAIDSDVEINLVAQKIRFVMTLGENFFMEIAKLRAVKMMWAQIVREFGGDDESAKIKLHVSTGSRNKTRHDPYVNMLRVTTEAMAGAIGGVDGMSVTPFDQPFGESDDFSRRIARNVQLILQEEVNLVNVIDPAGGSWYIEHLTNQLAQSAWDFFQQIEAKGGMIQALQDDFIQSEVQTVAEQHQKNIASRKDVLVGTNMYPNLGETMLEDRDLPPMDISAQLDDLMIEATPLTPLRFSEAFERLRANAEQYKQQHGHNPQIFLANLGELFEYKARMDFTRGFYEVGGFELIDNGGYADVEGAVTATVASHAQAVVICSTDAKYEAIVPEFTLTLKAKNPDLIVILAGYPPDKIDEYRNAGVDDFIHIRANCYDMNKELQDRLGVGK